MNPIMKVAATTITVLALGFCEVTSVSARAPRPLYNNINPQTNAKLDPLRLSRVVDGALLPLGVDLLNVLPATTVDEANSRFFERAGAAILQGATMPLNDGAALLSGNQGGEDYGVAILSRMAYADFFTGPDQVPGSADATRPVLRAQVDGSIMIRAPGRPGTDVDKDIPVPITGPTFHLRIPGDYDVLLTAYVKLYYKYYDALAPQVREHLFNDLLSLRGKYDPGETLSLTGHAGIGPVGVNYQIPETENHRLMIQSAKYLTNQLYYQASVEAGQPDPGNFDNNRNGNGGSNPPMVDVILKLLQARLTADFIEYNARPYQDYAMTAIMNLASFAYDARVRLAARMVLDYVSAKTAVSSNDLRRVPPYRRRNEAVHWGPPIRDGFFKTPLLVPFNVPVDKNVYRPDPQGAFYAQLAGNIAMIGPTADTSFTFEMVHAGLSDYRVPPTILDLFVSPRHRRFYQGLHHFAGTNLAARPGQDPFWYVDELYAASPSYLISAGGNPSFYAYVITIGDAKQVGDDADLGVAGPTVFMPTGAGLALDELIQLGKQSTDPNVKNLCVSPDFACGGPIYLPDAFDPSKTHDPTVVADGSNWIFVNRGGDASKPGYFLAIYRNLPVNVFGNLSSGFIEAYDTWEAAALASEARGPAPLTFKDFQQRVKEKNPNIQLSLGHDEVNTYVTQSGQTVRFTLSPHSTIISTTAEPDRSTFVSTFAHGSIMDSPQDPSDARVGSGLLVISNPRLGTRITLDMRNQSTNDDPLFGLHHPRRTAEDGRVESAGANEDVWLDFNYTGDGKDGDFGQPFKTLKVAQANVARGGTVNIVPGHSKEALPLTLNKPMTLKSFCGTAAFNANKCTYAVIGR